MNAEFMKRLLPDTPPDGLVAWAKKHCGGELGPDYIIFHSERVAVTPPLEEIMEYNSMRPRRHEWVARCTCTKCTEEFVTQKVPGVDAVRIAVGEDGIPYPLDPGEPYGIDAWNGGGCAEEAFSGENMICPICLSECELIHSKYLRGGRTKRIMLVTVQNIEQYTAIIYWLVCRHVDEYGLSDYDIHPADAYVLNDNGTLAHYSHISRNGYYSSYGITREWIMTKKCEDKIDTPYPDWGSICNRKCGAEIYSVFPDMEGTTGEKTGLIEFLRAGGYRAIPYLKFWRTHKSIENLLKCGQADLVVGIFRSAYRFSYEVEKEAEKYIDLNESKPHKMLRISKEDFRGLRNLKISLKIDDLDRFNSYKAAGGKCAILEFFTYMKEFKIGGMNAAIDVIRQSPEADLDKIARYMMKQHMRLEETGILLDARRMARDIADNRQLTPEELWPRNLSGMHEHLNRIQAERRAAKNEAERAKMTAGFQGVIERYGSLQWNDGELCVILPQSSDDLHREGEILRHCVGGFSNSHIKGTDTIFFIRHYRRPERPYYTLDINMSGKPKEVQLHGYGNERHGVNKEYSHKIPAKVRAFCDRWIAEVLMPFYYEQQRKEKSA